METIKLNSEICEEKLDALRIANEQWFYGYEFSVDDYLKLVDAVKFFDNVKVQQRRKLIKEGRL